MQNPLSYNCVPHPKNHINEEMTIANSRTGGRNAHSKNKTLKRQDTY